MDQMRYVRIVRTPSSERVLLQSNGQDIGALDIHFQEGGRIFATLVLLEEASFAESDIEKLVEEIDDVLLPGASRDEGNVVFTLVKGRVLGSYVGQK